MNGLATGGSEQSGPCMIYQRRAGKWNLLIIRITGDMTLDDAEWIVQPAFNAIPGCSRVTLELNNMCEPKYPLLMLTCLLHRYAILYEKKFSIFYETPELRHRVALYADFHRETGCKLFPGNQCIQCDGKFLKKVGGYRVNYQK